MNGVKKINFSQSIKVCLPFYIVFAIITFCVKDHAFFWDTVQLASKQAHWFFDNNFQYFFLSPEIDSGHPPFFGILLASVWNLFGKSLWVSHLMMLPFLVGIVYLLYQIGEYFLGKGNSVYLLLLIIVDPFFIGQSVLVSPDIVLIFGWLLALWAVIYRKKIWLVFATLILAAVSMRGMMIVFSVFLFELYRLYIDGISWKTIWRIFIKYVPSGLFALTFLYFHYRHAGWVGYHEGSSWAPLFERVSFKGFLYNIALLGWRLLDFGRVFLWLIISWGMVVLLFKKASLQARFKELIALLLFISIVLTPSMLLHKGLMAHRYLLPVVLMIDVLAIAVLFEMKIKSSLKKSVYFVIAIGLGTGNFWVYPNQIAQGWDSTLAHLPYYDLRKEMIDYLDKNEVPLENIGTEFPMLGKIEFHDLNDRKDAFHQKDIENDSYILYSNISNSFADEELEKLESDFEIQKEITRNRVCMILYKRKE